MEMSDSDGDSGESEDQDADRTEDQGEMQDEPNLDDFMDEEYLKQGKHCLQILLHHN